MNEQDAKDRRGRPEMTVVGGCDADDRVRLCLVFEIALDVGKDIPGRRGYGQARAHDCGLGRGDARLAAEDDLEAAEANLLVVKVVPVVAEAAEVGVCAVWIGVSMARDGMSGRATQPNAQCPLLICPR
jgi:hypothetical protein